MPPYLNNPVFSESLKRPVRDRSLSPPPRQRKGHKPVRTQPLKFDGSNYGVWSIKNAAQMRYAGISATEEEISPELNQIGLDLLIDSVEDGLLQHVQPPGPPISIYVVLQHFQEMFGKSNSSFHADLVQQLWTLRQLPAEGINAYSGRSCAIHDQLVRSGGAFPPETFLQCFERGLQEVYHMTCRFLHVYPARATFSNLLGELLAEEARLQLQHGLHGGQVPGMAGAVAETSSKKWQLAKGAAGAAAAKNSSPGNKCWNCNKEGHKTDTCPDPVVKPWRHVPAGFRHAGRRGAGNTAAAKPAAGPVI